MNAKISISNIKTKQNEKTADISVKYSQKLKGVILNKKEVVNMIDEIPIFALIACYANGTTKVSDAIELRYKESDRIESIIYNLKKCGAKISELNDGFIIYKSKMLYNTSIKDFNDHRIAMMCEILYLVENKKINTLENKVIKTSFPNFYQQIRKLYEKV